MQKDFHIIPLFYMGKGNVSNVVAVIRTHTHSYIPLKIFQKGGKD